jgi:DNA (cytosine-5)-methyltransferase 1
MRKVGGMRVVDLFAGWGGFTLGAEMAGAQVLWAANHWRLAVDAHQANHPRVRHACQDLRQADWTSLPQYDLLCASPACQGHSTASQARRRQYHDAQRNTAFAVIDCCDITEPAYVLVENVLKFREWRHYPYWCGMMREMGYHLTERVARASHHGVPQRRDRLFIFGSKRRAIKPPLQMAFEPAFGPCIDWDEGNWRHVSKASPGGRERLEASRRCGQQALVQHTTGHRGIPLSEPIRTITTQDQWVVRDGDMYRPLTLRELARGMGFPDDYMWPKATRRDTLKGLGNAVCPPVARDLISYIQEAA